jgi:hypothetical protein
MLRFGGHLTGFSIVNYLAEFDNPIGRYWGAHQLVSTREPTTLLLPIDQVNAPSPPSPCPP